VDPNLKFMLDELQKMEARLDDYIEGCCVGLENRVEQHS
jgi:hypothetical protein